MSDLARRRDNYLRALDSLRAATDAGCAWLPICADDDEASGAIVLELARRGYAFSQVAGLLVVSTGQPGNRIWEG